MRRLLPVLLLLLVSGCGDPAETTKQGMNVIAKTLDLRAKMEGRQLRTQAEQYHVLHGEWPESWADLRRPGVDPWGHPYALEVDGSRALVSSAGPDGELGTSDDIDAE